MKYFAILLILLQILSQMNSQSYETFATCPENQQGTIEDCGYIDEIVACSLRTDGVETVSNSCFACFEENNVGFIVGECSSQRYYCEQTFAPPECLEEEVFQGILGCHEDENGDEICEEGPNPCKVCHYNETGVAYFYIISELEKEDVTQNNNNNGEERPVENIKEFKWCEAGPVDGGCVENYDPVCGLSQNGKETFSNGCYACIFSNSYGYISGGECEDIVNDTVYCEEITDQNLPSCDNTGSINIIGCESDSINGGLSCAQFLESPCEYCQDSDALAFQFVIREEANPDEDDDIEVREVISCDNSDYIGWEGCPEYYQLVCGKINGEYREFDNDCFACSEAGVSEYKIGGCGVSENDDDIEFPPFEEPREYIFCGPAADEFAECTEEEDPVCGFSSTADSSEQFSNGCYACNYGENIHGFIQGRCRDLVDKQILCPQVDFITQPNCPENKIDEGAFGCVQGVSCDYFANNPCQICYNNDFSVDYFHIFNDPRAYTDFGPNNYEEETLNGGIGGNGDRSPSGDSGDQDQLLNSLPGNSSVVMFLTATLLINIVMV